MPQGLQKKTAPKRSRRLPTGWQRLASPREQALLLTMAGRHSEAAALMLEAVVVPRSDWSSLTPEQTRFATLAARYLKSAGDLTQAAEVLDALGAKDRAAELRRQHGPEEPPSPEPQIVEQPQRLTTQQPLHHSAEHALRELCQSIPPQKPAPAPRARESVPSAIAPGFILAGRYLLERRIGAGGMADIFAARDIELDDQIAIKVFRQGITDPAHAHEALQRFRQELRLTRRLSHPNIIQVFDINAYQGHRYITMELLDGGSLKRFTQKSLNCNTALAIVRQVADGLAEAHRNGIVHRDIKPENLALTESGRIKIMDFGIAKCHREPGVTVAGTTAGTPEYMAPEQVTNFSQVSPAADQYSLGIVAYELLTGGLPFVHPEIVGLMWQHVQEPPPSLREKIPTLPRAVERLILKMLAKKPDERFASCETLIQKLDDIRWQLSNYSTRPAASLKRAG